MDARVKPGHDESRGGAPPSRQIFAQGFAPNRRPRGPPTVVSAPSKNVPKQANPLSYALVRKGPSSES